MIDIKININIYFVHLLRAIIFTVCSDFMEVNVERQTRIIKAKFDLSSSHALMKRLLFDSRSVTRV